jgi:adenosylcobinamide-GDP ribazoletransferase
MKILRQAASQIRFFTRIPVPGGERYDEDDFVRGIIYAPLAGLVTAAFTGPLCYLLVTAGHPALAAAAAVSAGIIITGGLHLDGLADTADGFWSGRPREQILAIMKDPRIGTFGVCALIMTVALKGALLVSLPPEIIIPGVAASLVLSRMSIVWVAGISRYPDTTPGMAHTLVTATGPRQVAAATILTAIILAALWAVTPRWTPLVPPLILAASIIGALAFARYSTARIGGVTGDTLGAAAELTELAVLAVIVLISAVTGAPDVTP